MTGTWIYDIWTDFFIRRDADGHEHLARPEHVFESSDIYESVGLTRRMAHGLWVPGHDPRYLGIRGGAGNLYTVVAGASATSATLKVMAQLATGTAVDHVITQLDVTMDGVTATNVPATIDIALETGASSGGSTYTPNKYGNPGGRAAQTTARINDTSDGASPTVQKSYYVPPTSGIIIQSPLAREKAIGVSGFTAFRITAPNTVNYKCNIEFEEGG